MEQRMNVDFKYEDHFDFSDYVEPTHLFRMIRAGKTDQFILDADTNDSGDIEDCFIFAELLGAEVGLEIDATSERDGNLCERLVAAIDARHEILRAGEKA
tara:strand:+ start:449 stop:748 length:300 start_codon:yes stop_codon:yes gene_type:complete